MAGTLNEPIRVHSVPEEIHRRILTLITERELVPGSQLPPERELARTLKVSRTTVRDALRGLADRGVLTARQGSGWYVDVSAAAVVEDMALHFRLSDMTLAQIMEARLAVEPPVTALAARRRTAEQLARLKQVVEEMEAVRTDTLYGPLADEFHKLLMEFADNPFFTMSLSPIYQLMKDSRQPAASNYTWDESLAEHRALAAAVERQDEETAFALARDHVNCVETRNMNYRKFAVTADPPASPSGRLEAEGS